ncbi:hypothetical protein GGD71_006684 [Variovorax guangxiensis]|uniref:DUF945 domain-containing protein n=1 Tax=Variovorax guangxiensis TaxID=1775474 RepID=A0A840G9I6_9BURK|nr:hypothetical protein [Variovorax guangxiensis]
MELASRFANHSPVLRSEHPLSDDQIRTVAPSIFAQAPHGSRSQRYSYIPTASVLRELRGEGFEPFMVCQTRVRQEGRRDFTKHMIRLRHASQINGREANEIILLNSHDGTSSYWLGQRVSPRVSVAASADRYVPRSGSQSRVEGGIGVCDLDREHYSGPATTVWTVRAYSCRLSSPLASRDSVCVPAFWGARTSRPRVGGCATRTTPLYPLRHSA